MDKKRLACADVQASRIRSGWENVQKSGGICRTTSDKHLPGFVLECPHKKEGILCLRKNKAIPFGFECLGTYTLW